MAPKAAPSEPPPDTAPSDHKVTRKGSSDGGPCPFETIRELAAGSKGSLGQEKSSSSKLAGEISNHSSGVSGGSSSGEKTGFKLDAGEGWTAEENEKRRHFLPNMLVSKRILSTSDPERFGVLFYEDLFTTAEPLRVLFEGKDMAGIASAFGRIPIEMLRLIMLPSKTTLQSEMYRLALRHVDYGAKRSHYSLFEASLLRTLARYVTREGGTWAPVHEKGWRWILGHVSDVLFTNLEQMTPKVEGIRKSWQFMVQNAARKLKDDSATAGSDSESENPFAELNRRRKLEGLRLNQDLGDSKKQLKLQLDGVQKADNNMRANNNNRATNVHATAVENLGAELTKSLRRGLPNKQFEWGPSHAKKLGIALELIVDTVTVPLRLEQELWRLAQKHLELGVGSDDLEVFEVSLFDLLRNRLTDLMYVEAFPFWTWMWENVKTTFGDILMKWQIMQKNLLLSWDELLARAGNSIGVSDHFYTRLFREAPLLQDIFQRRNDTMIDSFAKALDMIVRCSQDSSLFDRELEELAVRHCKFDLQSWHFDIFGNVLLSSLAEIVGEKDWRAEFDDAWRLLYNSISNVFLSVLDTAKNPMCNALVRNSVPAVLSALEGAPRQDRTGRVLFMKAGKRELSPILWALRDGLSTLTEVLIDELMTIRTDREACYYGVDEMWNRCPQIFAAIVEFAPNLIEQFFDGHMWVCKNSLDGRRRVNFWLKHIYGDPALLQNVFEGPLGVLVKHLPDTHISVFLHPIIVNTVELKWKTFARKETLYVLLQQLACLIAYALAFNGPYLTSMARLVIVIMWCAITASIALKSFLTMFRQLRNRQFAELATIWGMQIKVPRCLVYFYVQLRWFCCLVSLLSIEKLLKQCYDHGILSEHCIDDDLDIHVALAVLVAFTQWIQLSEFFKLNDKIAAVVYLGPPMLNDAFRFMAVMGVWLLAMGGCMWAIMDTSNLGDANYSDNFESADYFLAMVLGRADNADLVFYDGINAVFVRGLFLLMLWVSVVPILNLMIAAMVSSYSHFEQLTVALAIRARTTTVLEAEGELKLQNRKNFFESFGFEEPLPFTVLDKGPPGGISKLLTPSEIKEHPSYERREDKILFFSGSTNPCDPWPPHEIVRLRPGERGNKPASTLQKDIAELKLQLQSSIDAAGGHVQVVEEDGAQCFLSIEDVIYDVGGYLDKHPGGKEMLHSARGTDATEIFLSHKNISKVRAALSELPQVGRVVTEDDPEYVQHHVF